MSIGCDQLLVGIGSPFGDDRLGWIVAEEIRRRGLTTAQVRCARAPADLLDWLDRVERLVICDACHGDFAGGAWRRIEWPSPEVDRLAFVGTHDMSLTATLELAQQLGRLPERTTIWCMSVPQVAAIGSVRDGLATQLVADDVLSPEVAHELPVFVEAIEQDLRHA